jgi:hypothetical protein
MAVMVVQVEVARLAKVKPALQAALQHQGKVLTVLGADFIIKVAVVVVQAREEDQPEVMVCKVQLPALQLITPVVVEAVTD